jgi:drug/metabolite transporter (DMT)-like permease
MAGPAPATAPGAGRTVTFLVLSAALVAVGHAAIFVRLADAHPFTVAAYRLGIATLVLLPFALPGLMRALPALDRRQWWMLVSAAAFLAVHFATWIASLDHTSIANSVVLVTLTPVWLALWSAIVLRVHPGTATLGGVALATAGTAIIGWGSFRLGGASLCGDFLALVGGATFAFYLLCAQSLRRTLDLMPFVTLVYGGAGVLLWLLVFAMGLPVTGFSGTTWAALFGLALVSQIIGHSGLNWAVKSISPTFLALTILLEPVLSAALGWLWFGEGFTIETGIGGALALAAIWLGSGEGRPRRVAKTA